MAKHEKRLGDYCLEFGNGNISVKVDKKYFAGLYDRTGNPAETEARLHTLDEMAALDVLLLAVSEMDTDMLSPEPWSAGNSEMAYTLYNAHRDLAYNLLCSDLRSFAKTGKIKLFAHKLSEEERELYDLYRGRA